MSILDTFFILFESDSSKLDKGLEESDKKGQSLLDKLRNLDTEATKTGGTFRDMVGKLAAFAGVNLALGAFVHGVQDMAKEYVALGKLAAQFRATTDEVDDFRDAASLLGMTEESSTESLHSLERALQDTAMGMGRAQKVFEELKINVKDGKGELKSTTAVMTELAGKFKGMDQGKQIRIMERLGLDPGLLKLFNSDLGALQQRMADIDRATGFNLETAVKRAQAYTKASKEMGLEFNTLKMYLGKLSESFKIASLPWFTDAMKVATGWAHAFVGFLMQHSQFVKGFMIAAGAAISYFLIPAAIKGALSVWAMVAPFALVGAAALAVATVFALLYDDITNFLDGNDSLIGNILAKYPQVSAVLSDIGDVLKFIGEVVRDVARIVGAELGAAFSWLGQAAGAALDWIAQKFGEVGDYFRQNFGGVVGFFTEAGQSVSNVIHEWIDAIVAFIDKFGGIVGIAKSVAGAVRSVLGHAKNELNITDGAKAGPVQAATLPAGTRQALAAAQTQLRHAAASPLTSHTSNSIVHGGRSVRGGDRNVTVEKVEIHTQATDADGIARGVGESLGSHLRQANNQFDDGVAA